MFAEDNAQESDQDSAELADGEDTGSDTIDDSSNGDDNSGADGADENEGLDDGQDDGEQEEPMIPKSRLDEVIAQRDRERETNKLFASLLQNAGLDASGKKLEKPAPKVDLSGYKPEEIAQAKGLVEAMLSDKLQDVEQIKTQLSEFQQRDKERADAEAKRKRTEFEQQDEAELQAALKPYKGEFKRSEVEAQVVKWDASGDPKLKNLARSSYDVILMKMKKMKDDRVSKKPKVVPKVEADSHGSELREPTNRRVRPEPGNSSDWKDHLASEAQARMTPEE